ncbi:hypothetical protein [Xanthomonas oryzae]|uniref:hypothetical protein n=1 Tax=Xanthomonas oryzae TaxID=347 RepID=UPI00095B78EE|nr:hypothetical protein [Xanthomonas oryzae]
MAQGEGVLDDIAVENLAADIAPAATGSSCCSSRELDSRARVAKASAPRSSPTVLSGTGSSVLT